MFLLFKPSGVGFLLLAAGRILTDQTLKRNDSWENNSPSFWLTLASRDNYLCHQIHKKYGGQELGNWLAEDLPVPLPDVSLSLPEVTSILFFVEIIFNSFSTYICIPKSHDLVSLVLELHINKIVLCILPCSLFLLISYL